MAGGTGVTPGTIDMIAGSCSFRPNVMLVGLKMNGDIPEERDQLMQRQRVVTGAGGEHSARDKPGLPG